MKRNMKTYTFIIISFFLISNSFAQNENYPIPPKTNKLLFYIQRNLNANTIIYDAVFDKDGNLNKEKPIEVYWIRYAEQGQKMKLRRLDRMFAFGVSWKQVNDDDGLYKVKIVADESRDLWLKQVAPFKAIILTKINGEFSILDKIYVLADMSGMWPTVEYLEVFGRNAKTKKKTYQKIPID
ncbi:MAG: DUF4833 domain-containing protein [Chlorobi bacterium]|nr:DUF4833 domain-containing protein [Chlorobiota bacterium]